MYSNATEIRMPGPRLSVILAEITKKLIQDDWYRVSTRNQEHAYYVVGCKAQASEQSGQDDFDVVEYPIPNQLEPLSEWTIRSQVADSHRDYVKDAKTALQTAGVAIGAIDEIMDGEFESF